MASLLAELLHDTSRRGDEIAAELNNLQEKVPAEIEAYRHRMLQMVEQARRLIASMLADPDLEDPLYASNYFRHYKHVARLIQELENLPLLVLRRFSESDRTITAVVAAICHEAKIPFSPPVCSSISSQYYWTAAGMDVVFAPCLEPDHVLGLPDAYHELGHILLFRNEKLLVHPALTIVDAWYDKTLIQSKKLNWPEASRQELERFQRCWRLSWLLEFGSDLIATYMVGPAFGWCNIRTSTNLGGGLFLGSESHPADSARAVAIKLMLDRISFGNDGAEITERWSQLVQLSGESRPQRYELAYPEELLTELTEFIHSKCQALGLRKYDPRAKEDTPVAATVNDAWREFRVNPGKFGEYERSCLKALLALVW